VERGPLGYYRLETAILTLVGLRTLDGNPAYPNIWDVKLGVGLAVAGPTLINY